MNRTIDELRDDLLSSRLVTEPELNALEGSPHSAWQLTGELVARGVLTDFQARQFLEGRSGMLTLGRYIILEPIGAGGMGQVYRARHSRMSRVVALKVLSLKFARDAAAIARFEREVRAAAQLTHPNIVQAHDAGVADDTHFLVMEYVPGRDLRSVVLGDGPLPVELALDCAVQAAEGLQYAHDRGVIHRDIKPANLLLSDEGRVKVLDMGHARFSATGSTSLTRTGIVMGTVDYMSPEQGRDSRTADARADVYSLGCTLYFLLTGRSVYRGDSLMQRLLAHQTEPVPLLSEKCPEASEALDAVFQRMLARDVTERVQSMADVIDLLKQCRSGVTAAADLHWPATEPGPAVVPEEIEEQPPEPPRARRQLPVIVAAVLGVLVVASLAAVYVESQRNPRVKAAPVADVAETRPSGATVTPPLKPPPPPIELPAVEVAGPVEPALRGVLPGRADEPFVGLVGAPAKIPGIRRWQLQHADPFHGSGLPAWHPNGSRIAIGCANGSLRLYEVDEPRLQAVIPVSDRGLGQHDWHPDGRRIAVLPSGSPVEIWSIEEDGTARRERILPTPYPVSAVHWSPDGKWIAGYLSNSVSVWSEAGELVHEFRTSSNLTQLSWSPDSGRIACSGNQGNLVVVQRDGEVLAEVPAPEPNAPLHAEWRPNGDEIAGVMGEQLLIWDAEGKLFQESELPEKKPLSSVRWDPDGKRIAVYGTSVFWIISRTGELVGEFKSTGYSSKMDWSPDGVQIVRGGSMIVDTVVVDTHDEIESVLIDSLNRHPSGFSWHPDGSSVTTTVSALSRIHHWGLSKAAVTSLPAAGGHFGGPAWSPDGTTVAFQNLGRIELRDSNLEWITSQQVGMGDVRRPEWDATSQHLLTSKPDHLLLLSREAELQQTIDVEEPEQFRAVAWHPTESQFAASTSSSVLRYTAEAESLGSWSAKGVSDLAWTPDGNGIVGCRARASNVQWTPDGTTSHFFESGPNEGSPTGRWIDVNRRNGLVARHSSLHSSRNGLCEVWSPGGEWLWQAPCGGPGSHIEWDPQGMYLAVGTWNGSLHVWTAEDTKLVQTLIINRDGEAFILDADGMELLTGDSQAFEESFRYAIETDDGVYRTLKHSEFQELLSRLEETPEPLSPVEVNPGLVGLLETGTGVADADRWQLLPEGPLRDVRAVAANGFGELAVATRAGTLVLDATDLSVKRRLPRYQAEVTALAWSPDNRTLLVGDGNGWITLARADGTHRRLRKIHHSPITSVRWRADGSAFATGEHSEESIVALWSVDGTLQHQLPHRRGIRDLAWHPSRPLLATCNGAEGRYREEPAYEVVLWNEDGTREHAFVQKYASTLDWTPDGNSLYVFGRGIDPSSCAVVYDVGTQEVTPSVLPVVRTFLHARFALDGTTLAVADEQSLQFYGVDGKPGARYPLSPRYDAEDGRWQVPFTWTSDGASIAFASQRDRIAVGDLAGRMLVESDPTGAIVVDWSRDGRWVATAGSDEHVRCWSPDGRLVRTLSGHGARVRNVAWSPTDGRLASLADDGTLLVWNEAGEEAARYTGFHPRSGAETAGTFHDLAWHPSGRLIAGAGDASTLKLIDLEADDRRSYSMLGPVRSLAWSPDGQRLAILCEPNLLVFWEPGRADPVFRVLGGAPETLLWTDPDAPFVLGDTAWRVPVDITVDPTKLSSLEGLGEPQWSPDDEWLAGIGEDLEIRRPSGDLVATFAVRSSRPASLAWSPDGRRLAVTHADGTLRVRNLGSGRVEWLGRPTAEGGAVTLKPSGTILAGDLLDPDAGHVVVVHTAASQLAVSRPSESPHFRQVQTHDTPEEGTLVPGNLSLPQPD